MIFFFFLYMCLYTLQVYPLNTFLTIVMYSVIDLQVKDNK